MLEIKTPVPLTAMELAEYLLTIRDRNSLDKFDVIPNKTGNSKGQALPRLIVVPKNYRTHGGYWFFDVIVCGGHHDIDAMSDRFTVNINYQLPPESVVDFNPSEFDKTVKEEAAALNPILD